MGSPRPVRRFIHVGYRFFDREHVNPPIPFGWASPTPTHVVQRFNDATPDGGWISFDVKQHGQVAGATVPQVYVGPPRSAERVQQPTVLAGTTASNSTLIMDEHHLAPGPPSLSSIAGRSSIGIVLASWKTAPGCPLGGDADSPARLPFDDYVLARGCRNPTAPSDFWSRGLSAVLALYVLLASIARWSELSRRPASGLG